MKLLLKVSIFEWCDVGAEYAFVDLTQEWARSLLKRKAIFDVAHAQETELYEMHFWWDPCLWLGGDLEDVPEGEDLWEFLEQHLSQKQQQDLNGGYAVVLPDDLEVVVSKARGPRTAHDEHPVCPDRAGRRFARGGVTWREGRSTILVTSTVSATGRCSKAGTGGLATRSVSC